MRGTAHWRRWAAGLLTAVCIVYLVTNTSLAELQRAVHQADYWVLSVALFVSAMTVVAKGLRWYALYPSWARPTVGLAVAGVAAGQVANWAIPFRFGEVLRVGLVSTSSPQERGRGLAAGAGVLVVEKILDAALLLLTVTVLILLVGVPTWLSATALQVALVACALGLGVALRLRRASPREWALSVRSWSGRWLPARANSLLEDATGLGEGLSAWLSPGLGMQALLWSLVAWALGGVVNLVVFKSAGVEPRPAMAAALAVLAALYGAAVVPTLPGRIGIFQYICVVTLAPFGVGFEQALVFSLALYLAVYIPPMVIGLASMIFLNPAPLQQLIVRAVRRQL